MLSILMHMTKIHFQCYMVYYYINIPQFLFPLSYCWTCRLFPFLCTYSQSYNEHYTCLKDKDISGVHLQVKLLDYRICICLNLRDDCKLFTKWFYSSLHSYQQNIIFPIVMFFYICICLFTLKVFLIFTVVLYRFIQQITPLEPCYYLINQS